MRLPSGASRLGALIVIVQPGQIYGPHDHSDASAQLALAHAGRLRYVAGDLGLAWVHVADVAEAIVQALDRGRLGQARTRWLATVGGWASRWGWRPASVGTVRRAWPSQRRCCG